MPSGGGGGTVTNTSTPPKYALPYLTDIAQKASGAYGQTSQGVYPYQLSADPNALQLGAQANEATLANNAANSNLGQGYRDAGQIGMNELNSGYLHSLDNTSFNPTHADTSGVIQAAIDPLREDLMQNILPSIKSKAISEGAYGGPRQDFATTQAVNDFERNAQNTAATINYNDLARTDALSQQDLNQRRENIPKSSLAEQNLLSVAPGLASQGFQADLMPNDVLDQVGNAYQLQHQDQLDQLYQRWQMQQAAPWQGLPEYSQIISGNTIGGTSTSTQPGQSPIMGGLQGALGGLGIANALSGISGLGAAGTFLGSGAGLGGSALLGAILGGL